MRRATAKAFREAFKGIGLTSKDLGNLPPDFEDLYSASKRLIGLFEQLLREARQGNRQEAGTLLAEIQVELHEHIPFHQRSLKKRLDKVLDICMTPQATSTQQGRIRSS